MKAPATRPGALLEAKPGVPVHSSYKQTEVGVIPDDWDVLPLRSLVRCLSGGTPRMSDKRFWGGEIPWVSSKDMKVSRLSDAIDHVTALAIGRGTRLVDAGAILIVVRGMSLLHSLPVALVEQPVAFNQDLKALVPHSDVNSEFILGWLQVAQPQILLLTSEATHGTKRLPTGDLLAVTIAVPSFDEQRSIADALSDVDGLLAALETLIVKKHAIKHAALQQLLTAKTRLPGFTAKWQTQRLRDLLTYERPDHHIVHSTEYTESGDVPVLTANKSFILGYTDEEFGVCRNLPVIVFDDFTTASKFAAFPFKVKSSAIKLLRPKHDRVSLRYVFERMQLIRFALGDHKRYYISEYQNIEFAVPEHDEQEAIVAILSDIDAEILALKVRRDKTKQIKQGMMQQLLTGRVRLVKPQARAAQAQPESKEMKAHSWAFNEAVLISTLATHFGSEQFPLGRKRYTKLCYLLHRHAEKQAEGYLKKAAGPYNPRTKYGGPERIAVENGYVREHASGPYRGFVAANNIAQAEGYFGKWYGADCIQWLEQFRFKKNDDLEVLATVDMAAEELRAAGRGVDVDSVKDVIRGHPEWQAKLDRPVFSDANIGKALETSRTLFG